MNKLSPIAVGALLLSLCTGASAQSFESVTMTSDTDDIVFTLRADKPLGTPSVRTYEGSVRVRFPSSNAPESIQVKGDGAAVRGVDLRSGSHGTAVMKLDLGDQTKLSSGDVRVENRKHIAVVRIARDLLPPMREARVEPKPVPVAEAAPAAVPAVAAAASVEPEAAKKPLAPTAPREKKALGAVMATDTSDSPMPTLLAVSAILGLTYGGLRIFMKKQKGMQPKATAIDIVAQKRIGARHQLVIVRAFGREHLLSIQGGTTTPIATSDDVDEGPVSFQTRVASLAEPLPTAQRALPSAAPQKEEETPFGGELIRAALAQRLRDQGVKVNTEARTPPTKESGETKDKALSQAVAGLVRLRREAQL